MITRDPTRRLPPHDLRGAVRFVADRVEAALDPDVVSLKPVEEALRIRNTLSELFTLERVFEIQEIDPELFKTLVEYIKLSGKQFPAGSKEELDTLRSKHQTAYQLLADVINPLLAKYRVELDESLKQELGTRVDPHVRQIFIIHHSLVQLHQQLEASPVRGIEIDQLRAAVASFMEITDLSNAKSPVERISLAIQERPVMLRAFKSFAGDEDEELLEGPESAPVVQVAPAVGTPIEPIDTTPIKKPPPEATTPGTSRINRQPENALAALSKKIQKYVAALQLAADASENEAVRAVNPHAVAVLEMAAQSVLEELVCFPREQFEEALKALPFKQAQKNKIQHRFDDKLEADRVERERVFRSLGFDESGCDEMVRISRSQHVTLTRLRYWEDNMKSSGLPAELVKGLVRYRSKFLSKKSGIPDFVQKVASRWNALKKVTGDEALAMLFATTQPGLLTIKDPALKSYLQLLSATLIACKREDGDTQYNPQVHPGKFISKKALTNEVLLPLRQRRHRILSSLDIACRAIGLEQGFAIGLYERAMNSIETRPMVESLALRLETLRGVWPQGAKLLLTQHSAILFMPEDRFQLYQASLHFFANNRTDRYAGKAVTISEVVPLSTPEKVSEAAKKLLAQGSEKKAEKSGNELEGFRKGVEELNLDFRLTVYYLFHVGLTSGKIGETMISARSVGRKMRPVLKNGATEALWEETHENLKKLGVISDGSGAGSEPAESVSSDVAKFPKVLQELWNYLSMIKRTGNADGVRAIQALEKS